MANTGYAHPAGHHTTHLNAMSLSSSTLLACCMILSPCLQAMKLVKRTYRFTKKHHMLATAYTYLGTLPKARQEPLTTLPSCHHTRRWNSCSRSGLLPGGTRPHLHMTFQTCLGMHCARCGYTEMQAGSVTGRCQVCA